MTESNQVAYSFFLKPKFSRSISRDPSDGLTRFEKPSSVNHLFLTPRTSLYFSFVMSCVALFSSGTLFVFPTYADVLAGKFNKEDVSLFYVLGQTGEMSTILIGMCELYFGFGFHVASGISVVFMSVGYFLLTFVHNYTMAAICYFFIGLGSGGLMNNLVARNTHSFSIRSRGTVVGFLMGSKAISGLIWLAVCSAIPGLKDKFLVFAVCTLVFGSIAILLVEELETRQIPITDNPKYLTALSEDNYLFLDITGFKIFTYPEYWFLAGTMFVGYGTSITWASEMSVALVGLEYKSHLEGLVYTFVAVTASVRFFFGYLSDRLSLTVSRVWWLLMGYCFLLVGYLIFVIHPNLATVSMLTIFVGFGNGVLASMFGTILSILFGTTNFVFNSGALRLAGAAGILLFNFSQDALVEHYFSLHECSDHLTCYRLPFLYCFAFVILASGLVIYFLRVYPPRWILNEHVIDYLDQSSTNKGDVDREVTSPLLSDKDDVKIL